MTSATTESIRIENMRSYADQDNRIAAAMRAVSRPGGEPLRILEAGCGNRWPIDLHDIPFHITGVDLDAAALDIRKRVEKDLDEAVHADLCTVQLPAESFDVVYSAYVLEHIPAADRALEIMIAALKPGGLLILRIPDPNTARGLVTRTTPFWFHVVYHRWVMHKPMAGRPGHAPYPTFYHPVISQSGIRAFARQHQMKIRAIYADTFARDGKGLGGLVFRTGARAIALLTLGRFTSRYSDLIYIFEK